MAERSNADGGPKGPRGHPTPPPSGGSLQNSNTNSNSMEGVGVGGQKRLNAGGGDSEEHLLEQQQMWKEVSVGGDSAQAEKYKSYQVPRDILSCVFQCSASDIDYR